MIYQNYYRMMLKIAYDILHDSYLAEDTVQDTFIKLLKISRKLDIQNKTKMKNLLIVMTRNTAIDYYRKRHRENLIFTDNEKKLLTQKYSRNLYSQEKWEDPMQEKLYEAILKLPVLYQDIFTLKYQQNFSNRIISQLLNISPALVRKRLSRGKKKLEEILNSPKDQP